MAGYAVRTPREGLGIARLMQAEGQGVWRLTFISAESLVDNWDEQNPRYLATITKVVREIMAQGRPDKRSPLCLTCDTPFWSGEAPMAFVLLEAQIDNPAGLIASGICGACRARHGDELQAVVVDAYRRELMPDLRAVSIHGGSGTA